MKIKNMIPAAAVCLLLTGCAQSNSDARKPPKINYSDMFKPSSGGASSSEKNTYNGGSFSDTASDISEDDADADGSEQTSASDKKQVISENRAANGATETTKQPDNENTEAAAQKESNAPLSTQTEKSNTPSAGTQQKTPPNAAVRAIANRKSSSVIYTSNEAVANLQLGDICYFPYKTASGSKTQNENVMQPKEPAVSNDNGTLRFTPGISQSDADEINKLGDSKVKEMRDIIDNITAEAGNNAGLNAETKFYAAPVVYSSQKANDKSVYLNMTFKNENGDDIRPQSSVTVKLPVPSRFKNASEVSVYRMGANNTPEKLNTETQTVDGAEYIVIETSQFGLYALTNTELKKSEIDKLISEAEKKEEKYDHGYRVVFKTETDTYLLGIFPHDNCKWNEANDMCREIESLIEADCQMVGIPSLEDLRYFTDCGIYLSGQYDMWTSTSASPNNAYYRNNKGAFYSTRSKSKDCGVCAIIRISAPQDDASLLSSALPNYEEAKARLEAEEEQYKLPISE